MKTNQQPPNQTDNDASIQAAYQVMSVDKTREAEADEWSETLVSEFIADSEWSRQRPNFPRKARV